VKVLSAAMFESRTERLLPLHRFLRRMGKSTLLAGGIVLLALGLGVAGYHWIAALAWVDAILEASMILTGMGPVHPMSTTSAKLFASAYALFSGVVFLSAMSFVLAPIFHRVLHTFHLDEESES
jgi:hypothetical protein